MNTLVRASVLALALAGVFASLATPSSSNLGVAHVSTKVSAGPPAVCPPDGSTDCGIGGYGW